MTLFASWAAPLGAVIVALGLGAALILSVGKDPVVAYRALFSGGFGSLNSFAETMAKTTPLLFIGLGVAIAGKASLWNIGAEGQFYVGALGAAFGGVALGYLPSALLIPAMLTMAAIAGGLWGAIPGYLKARHRVSEIIVTIMLNYVAIFGVSFFIHGPFRDVEGYLPQSPAIAEAARLPVIVGSTRLHAGILFALGAAALSYFLLGRTATGFRIKAVGSNPVASRFSGINVARSMVLAMAISGGLAGLAGMAEVAGIHHRLMDNISPGYGFTGIVVALLGKMNPAGVVMAAILFAGLTVGADAMQRAAQLSTAMADIIQGLVVLFFLGAEFLAAKGLRPALGPGR